VNTTEKSPSFERVFVITLKVIGAIVLISLGLVVVGFIVGGFVAAIQHNSTHTTDIWGSAVDTIQFTTKTNIVKSCTIHDVDCLCRPDIKQARSS
jgi:hypothetical protein